MENGVEVWAADALVGIVLIDSVTWSLKAKTSEHLQQVVRGVNSNKNDKQPSDFPINIEKNRTKENIHLTLTPLIGNSIYDRWPVGGTILLLEINPFKAFSAQDQNVSFHACFSSSVNCMKLHPSGPAVKTELQFMNTIMFYAFLYSRSFRTYSHYFTWSQIWWVGSSFSDRLHWNLTFHATVELSKTWLHSLNLTCGFESDAVRF